MGGMKVHGGGAATRTAAGDGAPAGGGGTGFKTPPGLAGRGWESLPPGIRKKVPKPTPPATPAPTEGKAQARDGASERTKQPTSGGDAKTSTSTSTPAPATTGADAGPTDAELAAREQQMEQYLADLAAGKATRQQAPDGFQEWARMQLLRETGRDETMQPAGSLLADTAAAAPA